MFRVRQLDPTDAEISKGGIAPAFNVGPFLPVVAVRERGFAFNDVFRDAEIMAAAARMSFELGFESTVVPFDMNVEAEALGGGGAFSRGGGGGIRCTPPSTAGPVACGEDVILLGLPVEQGRLSRVLDALKMLKRCDGERGAVGVFLTGPFTLAGQVMEPEPLFMMLAERPGAGGADF